jgi:hypothetical protein
MTGQEGFITGDAPKQIIRLPPFLLIRGQWDTDGIDATGETAGRFHGASCHISPIVTSEITPS